MESLAESDRRNAERGWSGDVITINRLIESMCYARRGDLEKAKAAFTKADKLLLKKLTEPDLIAESDYWHDWLIAKLLHDEACKLLGDADGTAATPDPQK